MTHNFNGLAAEIHCKIAKVYLRKRQYEMARIQAEESITCNRDCLQVLCIHYAYRIGPVATIIGHMSGCGLSELYTTAHAELPYTQV